MKIVFFGTPDYVLPILDRIAREYNKPNQERQLIAVVTQPPKPVGREKKIERSAVDNWAFKRNIDIIFEFDDIPQADLGIVAAYGRIIPQNVINTFSLGVINIHPSLLPQFRGASPIQATIATGTNPTGVSFIQMDEIMDHGPILTQFREDLLENDTFETLRERLFRRAADVLIEMLPPFLTKKIKLKPQDHDRATFTTLIKKDHGFIPSKYMSNLIDGKEINEKWEIGFIKNFAMDVNPKTVDRFIRAVSPWPGAWTFIKVNGVELRLKIHSAHVEDEKLILDEVQLEGKEKVSWEQFKSGYKDARF